MKSGKPIGLMLTVLLAAGCSSNPPPASPQAQQAPSSQGAQLSSEGSSAQQSSTAAPAEQSGSSQPQQAEAVLVYFDSGQAALDSTAQPLIDYTAQHYRQGQPAVLTVIGYTDNVGGTYPNLVLSARRAQSVKQALVARGIPAERIQIQALGESDPAVQAGANTADAQNRRVRITFK